MIQDPDFARLHAALHSQSPTPDPAAQQAALTLALANFTAKPTKRGFWDRLGSWRVPVWAASAMAVGVAVVVVMPRAPEPLVEAPQAAPAQANAPIPIPAPQNDPMPQMRGVSHPPQGLEAPVWQDLRQSLARGERPKALDPIAMLLAFDIPDPDAVMRHVLSNRPAPTDLATQIASLARLLQGDPAFADLTAPALPEAPQIAALIAKARALPPPKGITPP